MGEICTEAKLENTADRALVRRGHGTESEVRRTTVDGIVDTGAVTLMLPQNVVDLIADCANRTVTPRHPDDPLFKLK